MSLGRLALVLRHALATELRCHQALLQPREWTPSLAGPLQGAEQDDTLLRGCCNKEPPVLLQDAAITSYARMEERHVKSAGPTTTDVVRFLGLCKAG